MPSIRVSFSEPRSSGYQVLIQPGLTAQAGKLLAQRFAGCSPFVMASRRVWGLHGAKLSASLARAGFKDRGLHLLKDGEQHKSFEEYHRGLAALAAFGQGRKRRPLVLLFGGGVAGDLGGFVAATYKRGVPFVQMPTTLLSMVDSSVGGKLGIDFATRRGVIKNLVGSFAQPELVLADTELLATLPLREVKSGLGEAVKTALLFDARLFSLLERRSQGLLKAEPGLLARVVAACARAKARVVGRDEFDRRGERALLNLGHTFGHALESAAGLSWRHGEAVALGLACAVDLSLSLGLARDPRLARVEPLLRALGLPVRAQGLAPARVMAAMSEDKKFQGGLRFVLPLALGSSRLVEVKDLAAVERVVRQRMAAPAKGA
jgi:3-dehydroquinate synthase